MLKTQLTTSRARASCRSSRARHGHPAGKSRLPRAGDQSTSPRLACFNIDLEVRVAGVGEYNIVAQHRQVVLSDGPHAACSGENHRGSRQHIRSRADRMTIHVRLQGENRVGNT